MKRKSLAYFLVCLMVALSLCLGSGCVAVGTSPPSSSPESGWTVPPAGENPPLPDFVSVIAKIRPSVVAINTEVVTYDIFSQPVTQQGAGSGWIIDANGLIVTNNHVIEGAKSITVTLADERTFSASVVGADSITDLAVLRVDAKDLVRAPVGDSSQLSVGEWVLAVGNSLGMGISAKEGIVSRLGVSISMSAAETLRDLIETSAAINPGNSGGPLVNMSGEVVGITSAKISAVGVEGMGYAISAKTATPVVEELLQEGYVVRPWLGITSSDVNQWLAFRYGLAVSSGAFVTQVAQNSPAAEAGIKPGDVIVSLGSTEITGAQELVQAIHNHKIGDEVEIIFWRGDVKSTTRATLTQSPPP